MFDNNLNKGIKGFKTDITEVGSGSTGATNVKRVLGTKWFFAVLLLDAIKGAIPVLIAYKYFNFLDYMGLAPVIAATCAIIGHCKSIFIGFKGGKSVATGIGTILALCWPVGLILALVWATVTYVSKYVSLGSIVAICLSPILMAAFSGNLYYICFSALCAIIVVLLHKENIKRLIAGTENKVRE